MRAAIAASGVLITCLVGSPAAAQIAQAPPFGAVDAADPALNQNDANTQVYDQAFFSQYGPNNAEDILRRLPGVQQILDSLNGPQGRGLGSSGDQILIDGRRMAAKGQIGNALRRLPAASIQRVELVRGGDAGSGVLSEGLMVNIVLKPGISTGGQGSFEISYKFDDLGWSGFDGLVSYAGNLGKLGYVVAAQRDLWSPFGGTSIGGGGDYTRRVRDEVYFYPLGTPQELRPQTWRRDHRKKTFTLNATYSFDNNTQLRLNALYQPAAVNEIDITPFARLSASGAITLQQTEFHERKLDYSRKDWGGEFETRAGIGQANLIYIASRTDMGTDDYRVRADTRVFTEVSKSGNRQKTAEDIIRPSYAFPLSGTMDLNVGGELARNKLEQDLQVFFDRNRDGLLEPVVIPTAHAEVKEIRGELFAINNWRLTPKLTLESSMSYERSSITTNYPAIPKHTYSFLKPRADLRYNVTPRDRVRFKVERTISQLSFNNFVPAYNVVDDRIDLGNPEIAPEKTWIFEGAYEHQLANDNGNVEGRAFYRDITDHIDRGPFGPLVGGLVQSAPVNIPKAKLYGAEIKGAIRLAVIGLRDAQINFRYMYQMSDLIDPFTLRERKMKDPYYTEATLGFRHDLTGWGASYGANMQDTGGYQLTSDVRNRDYYSRVMRFDAFVEKQLWANLTVRFEAYNLSGSKEFRRRLLYSVSQADGRLSQTQYYKETRDRRFALRLRGKF